MAIVKEHMKGVLAGGMYVLCNYIINIIPCWTIRKLLYRACGMKIGKHSRIMMKTIVTHPWKIKIGENTTVNEYCYLDGRGCLVIGNNVNVALFSMLITGTHDHTSKTFDYFNEPIVVEDDVWLGARAIVLNGSVIGKGCLISANAVVSPRTECEAGYMYAGAPAKPVKSRGLETALQLTPWRIHFR